MDFFSYCSESYYPYSSSFYEFLEEEISYSADIDSGSCFLGFILEILLV